MPLSLAFTHRTIREVKFLDKMCVYDERTCIIDWLMLMSHRWHMSITKMYNGNCLNILHRFIHNNNSFFNSLTCQVYICNMVCLHITKFGRGKAEGDNLPLTSYLWINWRDGSEAQSNLGLGVAQEMEEDSSSMQLLKVVRFFLFVSSPFVPPFRVPK